MKRLLARLRSLRIPRLTIRQILLITTVGLTLMLVVFMVRDLMSNAQRLSRAYELRAGIAMSDYLFDATERVSVERDLALAMLQASDPLIVEELAPRLRESRAESDQAVNIAIAELRRFDLPELEHLRQSLQSRHRLIQSLRPRIDAMVLQRRAQRPPAFTTRWANATGDLTSDADRLWLSFIRPYMAFDATVTQNLRYRQFLKTLTDRFGRERSTIGQILSEGVDPSPEQVAELLRGEGILSVSWDSTRILAEQSGLYASIATQYTDARSHYATLHDMSRELFYVPGARHYGVYPIGPDLWFELSSQAAESMALLRTASRNAARAHLDAMIASVEREIAGRIAVLIAAVLMCGLSVWLVVRRVIQPIDRMIEALTRATRGEKVDLDIAHGRADEIGKLSAVLRSYQDKAEEVRATAQRLDQTVRSLEDEVGVRRAAEERTQAQLERLALLHQISRAIGERQETASIHEIVLDRVVKHLPVELACVGLYDPVASTLEVAAICEARPPFAERTALAKGVNIEVGQNGLSRCVMGQLVYEPNVAELDFAFPQRLAEGGLRAFVGAPLQIESQVFGILFVARQRPSSFSSGECEFLRQLSEHLALAIHQAQLNDALRQAYEDLRQTQEAVMQQERLRSLGQMASGIAHDINNALSPVALYTESLLSTEAGLSPAGRNKLEVIQRAIDDAAATIARMSELYRRRDTQMTLAPVAARPLFQQVLDLTRARWSDMAHERGVLFDMRIETEASAPAALGVEGELREAFTNLVFNAIDAMPEGGVVTMRARPIERADRTAAVALEVEDAGAGMDEQTRRRCLEPFFTTKGERGSGLGLAMVHATAQRHGGEMEIESEPGRGTVVRLVLAAAASGSGTTAGALSRPSRRLAILVVDDDPLVLRSMREVLTADGHVVITADGGQKGLDAFNEAIAAARPLDVVITDLGMPRVDGRQVARSVKSARPSLPVILLTGWGERLRAEDQTPAHVDYVLSKPARLGELRATLAQCELGTVTTKSA
jgi:signal transduction histidine kinase/ActR/RegA family two-component response regulator